MKVLQMSEQILTIDGVAHKLTKVETRMLGRLSNGNAIRHHELSESVNTLRKNICNLRKYVNIRNISKWGYVLEDEVWIC